MIITVKDIIEYLYSLPPTAEVYLDKDGWMEDDTGIDNPSVQNVIRSRGVFNFYKGTGDSLPPCLIINN